MKAALIAIALFVLGAATGTAVTLATRPAQVGPAVPPRMPPEVRAALLGKRLGLSPDQQRQALALIRAHMTTLGEARGELVRSIRDLLDEEQRRRFRALLGGPP